jgi:hypothetical protein
VFGTLIGGIFFNVRFRFDNSLPMGFASVTWSTALCLYVFLFKSMYFNNLLIRAAHERSNRVYSITSAWVADLLVNLCWVGETVFWLM